MNQWLALFHKDLKQEFRQPQFLLAVVFFQFCLVFLYFLFHEPVLSSIWWSSIYWINLLIAALSLSLKNFTSETSGQFAYYFQITNPITMYLSKWAYNFLLILFIASINFLLFWLLFEPVSLVGWKFFLISMSGIAAIALSLTLVSFMSGYSRHAAVLINILSIPLIIPVMLLLIRTTTELSASRQTASLEDLPLLLGILLLALAMALGLFPYLWRR